MKLKNKIIQSLCISVTITIIRATTANAENISNKLTNTGVSHSTLTQTEVSKHSSWLSLQTI